MKISWNWLSEIIDLTSIKTPERLAEILTQRGLEVEAIENQGLGFEKVVAAKILKKEPHPEADRLSLCWVDIGNGEAPLEIVCGAKNMKAGDIVALAQVGAHLPNQMKIVQSKIRGKISNGMLCSEEELKLKDSSEGILILPPQTQLGTPLIEVLNRKDIIFTLKITPNRSDCLSHWGIARELSSAIHQNLKGLKTYSLSKQKGAYPVTLHYEKSSPQFFGCLIQGVKVEPSPSWLSQRLEALGFRSINNLVDITNWVLLELGHPVHAYDADQIEGQRIQVRLSEAGEKISLLDGKTIELLGNELVVTDDKKIISLAGIMGGANSEVQNKTQNVYLECAEFDPILVRQAATRHQKKTEASYRFERGIDSKNLSHVLSRLVELILQIAGGQVIGVDQIQSEICNNTQDPTIFLEKTELQEFLGFDKNDHFLTEDKIEQILKALGCKVENNHSGWNVSPPSYRLDLTIKQDLAEEVARTIGYDLIPSLIPPLSNSPTFGNSSRLEWDFLMKAKHALAHLGFSETLNYAFTSEKNLSDYGYSSEVSLLNPLSDQYKVLVPSLLPGLLKNAEENWNHHFGSEPLSIRLFEIRPTFERSSNSKKNNQIQALDSVTSGIIEKWKLSVLMTGSRYQSSLKSDRGEIDFFDLKASLESLLDILGARGVRFHSISQSRQKENPIFNLLHPGQSVEILAGNQVAGYCGMLHPQYHKQLKAKSAVGLIEIDWSILKSSCRKPGEFSKLKMWPSYPAMERDFALVIKNEVSCEKICQVAMKAGKPLAKKAKIFDIYRGNQVAQGMASVAVKVTFYDETRSLLEEDAEKASLAILEAWKQELGAELRN